MPEKTVRCESAIPAVSSSMSTPARPMAGSMTARAAGGGQQKGRNPVAKILAWSAAFFLTVLFLLTAGCGGAEKQLSATQENAVEARNQMRTVRGQIKSSDASYLKEILRRGEGLEKSGGDALEAKNYAKALSAFAEARKCYRKAIDIEATMQTKLEAALSEKNSVVAAKAAADEAFKIDARPESFITAGNNANGAEEALAKGDFEKARELFVRATSGYKAAQAEAEKFMRAELARPALTAKKETEAARSAANAAFKTDARPEAFVTAGNVEKEAEAALAREDFEKAKDLFARATDRYKVAQAEGESLMRTDASRDAYAKKRDAEAERLTAIAAFRTDVRPESFVNAANCAKEGEAALSQENFAKAKELYTRAFEGYKAAQADAGKLYSIEVSRAKWNKQLPAAEALSLEAQAVAELAKLKAQVESATALMAKDPGQAAEQFAAATTALKELIAQTRTKANLPKSGPVVTQMENALRSGDWLQVHWTLGQLEQLIPADPRMADFRAKAAALPWPRELSMGLGGGVTMNLVSISPGSFEMGEGNEKHKVTLTKPFYIGRFEVTQQQWQTVMGNNPCEIYATGAVPRGNMNPVANVTWDTCQNFVGKLNEKLSGVKFALPTEAQWEYACRAGSTTKFCCGDDEGKLQEYASYSLVVRGGFTRNNTINPSGTKKPNAWGLCDMHGNVGEYCSDWFGPYPPGAQEDPQGPASGSERVWRGGSYIDMPNDLMSGARKSVMPVNVLGNCGLRLVLVTDAIAEYQASLVKLPEIPSAPATSAPSAPSTPAPPPIPPATAPTASLTMPSTPAVGVAPVQADEWMKWLPPRALPGFLQARSDAKAGKGLIGMRSWRAVWGNKLREPTRGFTELEFAELLLTDTTKAGSASAEQMQKQQNLREAAMIVQNIRTRNVTDPALLNRLEETAKKLP